MLIPLIFIIYAWLAVVNPDQPQDLISYIANVSGPVLMAIIIVGAIREWWVPGSVHRRTVVERDQLLELALRSQEVGEKALDTAQRGLRR